MAAYGTVKSLGLKYGDRFTYWGSVSQWPEGVSATLRKTGTWYVICSTEDGGVLDTFGPNGRFWAEVA